MPTARRPAPRSSGHAGPQRLQIQLGAEGLPVGELVYAQQGRRVYSQFAYAPSWLAHAQGFEISPDLPLLPGYQVRKASNTGDSVFHFALADTAPDAWGRRVIERAHAKARRNNPQLGPLTELDYLCAVDDHSRIGALRLQQAGTYLQTVEEGRRRTPPLVELGRLLAASRAVETEQDTAEDLAYLQGRGTSLGGMRPKCTLQDEQGQLAIGKFPSVSDSVNVTRAEVLALRLAALAGIRTARARCITLERTPVALIERFDRTTNQQRIPYLSAASFLQAERHEDRSYGELAEVMRQRCARPTEDVRELWRRLVFNLLITNTDDHLHNLGFLYAGGGHWQLAPAFDLNPMPGKLRESKTWLTEDTGPIDSLAVLLSQSTHFELSRAQATQTVAEVLGAVRQWHQVGSQPEVGLTSAELAAFEDAFEHSQTQAARALAGR